MSEFNWFLIFGFWTDYYLDERYLLPTAYVSGRHLILAFWKWNLSIFIVPRSKWAWGYGEVTVNHRGEWVSVWKRCHLDELGD